MKNSPVLNTYTTKERNMYLTGLAGQNILYNVISATLPYFLQFTLLIPAMAVSMIMAVARVWDAFNDPMMGSIVDRTHTKWGKCRPYLLFIPIPIGITTVLCFANGIFDTSRGIFSGGNALIVLWACFAYLMWELAYTIGDIPLWGITALMTENADHRNKLLSLARIVAGIGGSVVMLVAQSLSLSLGKNISSRFGLPVQEGERLGFILSTLIFTVVGTAMFQMAGLFAKERISVKAEKSSLLSAFRIMWKNKPFRQIWISGILGSPKQLMMLCAFPLVTYYYASKNPLLNILYILILGGGLMIGMFLAMGLSPRLVKKYEKSKLYNLSNLITIPPYLIAFGCYLLSPTGLTSPFFVAVFFVLFFICGAGQGLTSVLMSQITADCIDYEEYHNHIRPDGVFFSGQSFIAKLSSSIATIISGIAYSIVGFSDAQVARVNLATDAGLIPRDIPEFQPYMAVLFFLICIPPAIGALLSVIPTWKFALPNKEHERILNALNARRHMQADDVTQ